MCPIRDCRREHRGARIADRPQVAGEKMSITCLLTRHWRQTAVHEIHEHFSTNVQEARCYELNSRSATPVTFSALVVPSPCSPLSRASPATPRGVTCLAVFLESGWQLFLMPLSQNACMLCRTSTLCDRQTSHESITSKADDGPPLAKAELLDNQYTPCTGHAELLPREHRWNSTQKGPT